MTVRSIYLSIVFLFMSACKDSSPTEPSITGGFVVESLSASSVAGTNPVTHQNASQFTCTLRYHFERLPGTINTPSLVVNGDNTAPTTQVSYYNSYRPDTSLTNVQTIWMLKHISAQDSPYVHVSVWATFWTRVSKDSIKYYGDQNWTDSVTIDVLN
jgi:hypothetical protein